MISFIKEIKKYIKDFSIRSTIEIILFYAFFGFGIYFYDYSIVCKLITFSFLILNVMCIFALLSIPELIVQEARNKYKHPNPLIYGRNEFISLLFVGFLSYNEAWITLSCYIICATLISIVSAMALKGEK